MSKQAIVDRIISDAEATARGIINNAEKDAQSLIEKVQQSCERDKLGVEAEVAEKVKAIEDGMAAAARLDGAKVLLKEKRKVIDAVYANALKRLNGLEKSKALNLAARLVKEYAEEGDEIVFASVYPYKSEVAALPEVREKKLKISAKTADISGGFMLYGKHSDKDISFAALLNADRDLFQAEIAQKLFSADTDK